MAKQSFTGISNSYIFDNAGGMRDQLEQMILAEFQIKKYPLPARIQTIKAGGMFFGTKEQCVVIQLENESQIAISNTTVGTYLYVEVYLMSTFRGGRGLFDNVFKQQKRAAVYAAALEIVESAFKKLNLKQSDNGYKRDTREINEEE